MRGLRQISVLFLLGAVSAGIAFSQAVNGTIVGTVTDASGAAVANAKVTLTETYTKIVRTKLSNESGAYSFPELPQGTYEVAVEMVGFKKEVRGGVILEANTSPRVDMKLEPGALEQTVEVVANVAVLQTERADTGRSIDSVTIEELPLGVNRNFQSLLDLVPGTSVETFQHSQFFNASSSTQTNVNGMPRMGNNYQIEGIDNNERTGLLQILITPAEAIQSVSISTTNHDPELGRGTGAVTNVMIKSGTNNFHGSANEFLQNSAFDARSFFNPSVGHLAYNYFGGNIGGPIKKNKLFFFANYLRTMDHEANTNQNNIPDDAFRTGDLSGDPGHIVYDPLTGTQDGSGQNRTAFPGNIIPANRINPVSAKLLAYLPPTNENFSATSQTNDYFALLPAQKTNNQVDSKVDWTLSDKDRISGRFSFARPVTFQAPIFGDAGGPAQGAFEGTGTQKTYSTGINYNRVVSPTLLTEVRVGVAHYHNEAFQSDYGKNDSTNIGIPGRQPGTVHQRDGGYHDQRLLEPVDWVFGQSAVGSCRGQYRHRQLVDQDSPQSPVQVGRGHTPPARRFVTRPDVQPARRDHILGQPDCKTDLHHGAGFRAAVGVQHFVERPGERHGQLPAGCSQPGGSRCEYLLPGFAADTGFCLRRGQLAGLAETHAEPGIALGVLSTADAALCGRFLQLQPEQ